jgi:hypothetical protein
LVVVRKISAEPLFPIPVLHVEAVRIGKIEESDLFPI